MKHSWTVPDGESRQRLDVFIAERLPDLTRSRIAKLLKNGAGQVNGKPASVHKFLKAGDEVRFEETTESRAIGEIQGLPLPVELRIMEETDDWLVVDKPAGLLVHAVKGRDESTLADALIGHDPKIAKVGEDPERPGIVHRLDKEASGLMVVARTQKAFDSLKKQFAEHTVEKRYHALVRGCVRDDQGDIKFKIARSKTKARMAARPAHEEEGKAAWTYFRTLKRFKNASLLELEIMSGRTHQIRTHLLAIGHPIMGDPLYTLRGTRTSALGASIPRLMLQSTHLAFDDPTTGERREFNLEPVPEFQQIMAELS